MNRTNSRKHHRVSSESGMHGLRLARPLARLPAQRTSRLVVVVESFVKAGTVLQYAGDHTTARLRPASTRLRVAFVDS
jgi:hypothetical protein